MSKMRGFQVFYGKYLIGTYTALSRAIEVVKNEMEQMEVSEESIDQFEEECKQYLPFGLSTDYGDLMVIPIDIIVG